ncbi:MAG: PilZ domain-containing protein [Syntrophaceae bacterium]|nr:PilZ domain-containing protein [Syntrophaceae bacterium]
MTIEMEKGITVCFQITLEISNALDKIAKYEKRSVSEVVGLIIDHYLKENKEFQGIKQNRRRFERKKVDLPAYIGDPRWQRSDFEAITIMDISIGGIRFSIPKGTKLEIQRNSDSDTEKFSIIFRLPNYYWPINVEIAPQRVIESSEEFQVGAALVNPDFHAYSALQKYMI